LNSPKASRKQFRLKRTGFNYYIKDLGSSNGTVVNGVRLNRDEEKIINSGDVVSVLGIQIHFEIRDPNFEKRVSAIPEAVFNPPAVIEPEFEEEAPNLPSPYDFPQFPAVGGQQGGVIRLSGDSRYPSAYGGQPPKSKKKFIVVATGAIALLLVLIMGGGQTEKPLPKATPGQTEQFKNLSASQKQLIKDSYNLAKSLQLQGKYSLAAEQLTKIHELLPEGYMDSRKLAEDAAEAANYARRAEELQMEKERLDQIQAKVKEIIFRCEKISQLTTSVEEIQGCLEEAFQLDPENQQMTAMVGKVRQRAEDARVREEEKKDYAVRVEKARNLYEAAKTQENKRNWLAALDSYNRFLRAGLPDPDGLKSRAERSIASIRQTMSADVMKGVTSAESLFKQGNYKEALSEVDRARKIDPDNEKARDLQSSITRELNSQLQEIYSNSVLDEGLGNIEAAKEKWRKILEVDRKNGDYYKRARSKLRTYGAT
jgi:tetratricopeptide (TPR) repeat protein